MKRAGEKARFFARRKRGGAASNGQKAHIICRMRLFSELFAGLLSASGGSVRYTVAEGEAVFENVKRISAFSEERIVLLGRRGAVEVEGTGLSLGRYDAGDVVVLGTVARVTRI